MTADSRDVIGRRCRRRNLVGWREQREVDELYFPQVFMPCLTPLNFLILLEMKLQR